MTFGIPVEAELGKIPDRGPVRHPGGPDVAEAKRFVAETGVDYLAAVSVGIGDTASFPAEAGAARHQSLRIEEIDATGIPLVLHGASRRSRKDGAGRRRRKPAFLKFSAIPAFSSLPRRPRSRCRRASRHRGGEQAGPQAHGGSHHREDEALWLRRKALEEDSSGVRRPGHHRGRRRRPTPPPRRQPTTMDRVRELLSTLNDGAPGLLRIYRPHPTAAFAPREYGRYPNILEAAQGVQTAGLHALSTRRAGGRQFTMRARW